MKLAWIVSCSGIFGLAATLGALAGPHPQAAPPEDTLPEEVLPIVSVRQFTLNALDHHLDIYELRRDRRGVSRQIDAQVREYVGDLLFAGDSLHAIENDRYSGKFLDLGKEALPDTEFSLFYSLKLYKRTFRRLEFPYGDRFRSYTDIDAREFFRNQSDSDTSARVYLGHTYLMRLFHRSRVGDQRVFALRVVDFTPGVKVTIVWRELATLEEALESGPR